MSKLFLIRGLPSSGKSTLAKTLNCLHLEADMFFLRNGQYCFDATKLQEAHNWCQQATMKALNSGVDVVVSNTFTRLWELDPYLKMATKFGARVHVFRTTRQYQGNLHNVPEHAIAAMKARFEDYSKEDLIDTGFFNASDVEGCKG